MWRGLPKSALVGLHCGRITFFADAFNFGRTWVCCGPGSNSSRHYYASWLHREKSNLKTRGLLSNWRRIFLLEMVIKVLPSFLRVLLPCQWKYWHRAKNRLRDKTEFGMFNPQNVEKSGFGQSVCVSVCLSVRLSVLLSVCPVCLSCCRFSRELSQA